VHTSAAPSISLGVLGAVITMPVAFADLFGDFPRADKPADAFVEANSPADALVELTRLAIAHSPLLCIHAGVVSTPAGLIVVPGPSGLGKTTLVAALVRAGFGYVSDEALAIDRSTGRAAAFPRPLSMTADVWPPNAGEPPAAGAESLVAPSVLGAVDSTGGRVSDILLARRPGAPALNETRRGEAVVALLRHSFNHFADPAGSFRAVVGLVRRARVWQASYTEAPELAQRLVDQL
jgi:hypothetical protein